MGVRVLLSVAGLAVVCKSANPHTAYGGYTPASNVVEHSQIVLDIEAMTKAVNSKDYTTAKSIYENGRYSCKSTSKARTIKGFVDSSAVTSKLSGKVAFYASYITGASGPGANLGNPGTGRLGQTSTFWDDFVGGALAGTGNFAGKSDDFRMMAINKGVLGILTLYTARELEEAIRKAAVDQSTTDDKGAPHNWDEGWVFYYGSHATPGKYSAWEFTYKRDTDYTSTGATKGADVIVNYFKEGLKYSRTGTVDTAKMIKARNDIYRIFALSSIRAALKYSFKAQDGGYSEKYHMEAYTYWLAAAGWVAQANQTAAQTVTSLLDYTKTSAQLNTDLYCAVKAALVPAYASLGLDCTMVGTYKSLGTKTCSQTITCPSSATALSAGLATYVPDTTTSKGANVDCGYSLNPVSAASTWNLEAAWLLLIAGLVSLAL